MKDKINNAISRYLDIIANDHEIMRMKAMSFDANSCSSRMHYYLQKINSRLINDDLLTYIFVDIKEYLARYLAENCKIEKEYNPDTLKSGIVTVYFHNGSIKVDLKKLSELGVIIDSTENAVKASVSSEDYLVVDPDILKRFYEYYHNKSEKYKFIDKFYDNIYSIYTSTSSDLSFKIIYHAYNNFLKQIEDEYDMIGVFYLMKEILNILYIQDTRPTKLKVELYQDEENDCKYRFNISCD